MKNIYVTKSFKPPIEEYFEKIKNIFDNNQFSNRGKMVKELEFEIQNLLKHNSYKILLTNNGTIPIQMALKHFVSEGEVITTPFSFVATTSSILWENCTPRFVDIEPEYFCIDENKIEGAINENTKCILATHVFGNPCNVEKIDQISKKYNIPVIYDGAHAFGTKFNGKSIFEFGDISTCSFHATKIFHTAEGGCMFFKNKDVCTEIFKMHNFGISNYNIETVGINAKMSELNAALGLTIVKYFNDILTNRQKVYNNYMNLLSFMNYKPLKIRENSNWNYSYFPIIFENEKSLLNVIKKLNGNNIFPRRYFYPSLNNLDYVKYKPMKNSEQISSCILCLPFYDSLEESKINLISKIINNSC
jgi:dTDP-4-amino-4,6-dideoxygalactose transaminase